MDQVAFARFVRRAVDDAKTRRGWTVTRLAAETGVGRSTLFRWLAGDCHDFPELSNLRGFCEALEIPVSAAFTALGVRSEESRSQVDTAVHADIQRILGRLTDPDVSPAEKTIIRSTLRYLAEGAEAVRAG
jgi:transcriptional regulator with XRE-family HTH domain